MSQFRRLIEKVLFEDAMKDKEFLKEAHRLYNYIKDKTYSVLEKVEKEDLTFPKLIRIEIESIVPLYVYLYFDKDVYKDHRRGVYYPESDEICIYIPNIFRVDRLNTTSEIEEAIETLDVFLVFLHEYQHFKYVKLINNDQYPPKYVAKNASKVEYRKNPNENNSYTLEELYGLRALLKEYINKFYNDHKEEYKNLPIDLNLLLLIIKNLLKDIYNKKIEAGNLPVIKDMPRNYKKRYFGRLYQYLYNYYTDNGEVNNHSQKLIDKLTQQINKKEMA